MLRHSELFQAEGIQIDTEWLEWTRHLNDESQYFISEQEVFDENGGGDNVMMADMDALGDRVKAMEVADKDDGGGDVGHGDEQGGAGDAGKEAANDDASGVDDNDDGFSEVGEDDAETLGIVDQDTLLHDPELIPEELTFAPGEGQVLISVFTDENVEHLAFPIIFCGEKRPDNKDRVVPVHYSDICKYELRSVDQQVARHIPNLFFKMKKIQMKSMMDTVSLTM